MLLMLRSALVLLVLLLPTAALAQNQPPIADAGPDQTIFLGDSVYLYGSAVDPDGHPVVGWEWEVVSAPAGSTHSLSDATTPTALFTANSIGGYGITLRAWDGLAWSEPDALVVWIIENQAPDARASASPLSGPAPLTVHLDGSASSDPEGSELAYDWDFGDFTSGVGAVTTHTYAMPGTYLARLMVTDDYGNTDFDTVTITVSEPAVPSISPLALYTLVPGLLVGVGLVAMRRRRYPGPRPHLIERPASSAQLAKVWRAQWKWSLRTPCCSFADLRSRSNARAKLRSSDRRPRGERCRSSRDSGPRGEGGGQ